MAAFFCVFRPHCGNLTRKAAKGAVTGAKPTPRAFSAEIDVTGIKRKNGTHTHKKFG
jgi:hypothetical protein